MQIRVYETKDDSSFVLIYINSNEKKKNTSHDVNYFLLISKRKKARYFSPSISTPDKINFTKFLQFMKIWKMYDSLSFKFSSSTLSLHL